MELNESIKDEKDNFAQSNKPAKLKQVSEIDNKVYFTENDLVICSLEEKHIKETAELWANLACIQQLYAPQRYNFKFEDKNWQSFVRKKGEKEQNLFLVAHEKDKAEIKGFLYLQTITIPSSNLVIKGIIEDIYTKPQYRKQNIGNKMLKVAIEWAEKQNIKQVDLISLSSKTDLNYFYLNFIKGFKSATNLNLVPL